MEAEEPVQIQDVYEGFVERVLRPKLLDTFKASNQRIRIKVIKDMPTGNADIIASEELFFDNMYPIHTIADLCTRIYIEKGQREEYHPVNQCLLYPQYDEFLKRTTYLPFQYSFGAIIESVGLESPFRQMTSPPNKYFVDSTKIQKVSNQDILLEDSLYKRTPIDDEYILHLYIYRDVLRYYVGEKQPITRTDWDGKFLVYFPEYKKEYEDGSVAAEVLAFAPTRVARFEERLSIIDLLDEMLEGGKPLKRPGETTRGDVDLSSIRTLKFAWPTKIRGFQLEGLFYDMKVSDTIPYIRFYPKGDTPLSKLYVSDDEKGIPMLEDPSVLQGWADMRSITPDEDLLMAKVLLRHGSGSVHPLYATLFIHQDGSAKVVIQPASDEKGLSSQADLSNLSKTLSLVSSSTIQPVLPYTSVQLYDAHIILSLWLEPNDITRISRKRFDKILPYFKAFFQETSSPLREQSPILFLRYKCVSNFRTPGREAQFLQRVLDLQKGAGHTSMSFLLKLYKEEFDVIDSVAENRVAAFLKDITEYEMTDATTLDFTQKVNPGIDIAIFGKFPYYTFHIYRVDSLKTLERIKSLLSLLITVDPVELGAVEEASRVLEKEEDELISEAVQEENRMVGRVDVPDIHSLTLEAKVETEEQGEATKEYKLDALGDFPDDDDGDEGQTIQQLVKVDAAAAPSSLTASAAPASTVDPSDLMAAAAAAPAPPETGDEGEESDEDAPKKGKKKAVASPKSYFWLRLKTMDKKLFVYSKKEGDGVKEEITQYPSACAANALKQPAVMNEIQYKIMRDIYEEDTRQGRVQWIEYPMRDDEEIPVVKKADASIITEKITVLRYGSNLAEGQTNVYTCSEFWCMKDGIVILKEEFKGRKGRDGKDKPPNTCPFCRNGLVKKENRGKMTAGEKVIQRSTKDKSVEGKSHLYVQFLKSSVHPEGLQLPCCFLTDKPIYDTHPAFASRKADTLRLVSGVPDDSSFVEHVPMTASYGERLKRVASSYISGAEKLPLDFIDGVPKIGVLPPSADSYFAQKSIPNLVKQDHTVWKLMTDNKTGLPNASGFFRIAVENRKLFEADSFLAAIAPYFECSGANELRTLISTVVTPTLTASLNYGNFMFEFYNPQYRDPTQKELIHFTTAMGMQTSFGVRKEYIKRLWKSHMNFNDSLKSPDITKECRQFYNLFTVPNLFKWTSSSGKTYSNGVLFIILEIQKDGTLDVKIPPYGVTSAMADRCDIAFLLHYKAQHIWEPIFYTKNDAKKSLSTTTMLFARDVMAGWPSIVTERYNEFIESCKTTGLGVYTDAPEVSSMSLIPLSKAMSIPNSESVQIFTILRDVYNHVSAVLYKVEGEIVFLPVIDDGSIYPNTRVEFDWKNFLRDTASIDTVRGFYEELSTKYKLFDTLLPTIKNSYVIKNMFRLNKSAKDYADIYGAKLQGGLFIPVKKGSGVVDATTEEGSQLSWYVDNEIVFGKKTTTVADFDQKEFEEVFQHVRLMFANWLSQMREKDAVVKSITGILFDPKGEINMLLSLDEKRQRLFILFGHIVLSWLDSSLEVVNKKPSVRRIDCRVTEKGSCTNRCVWREDANVCLLHVPQETLVGRKKQNGKVILVKRLIEELIRFPKKRNELFTKGVRQYIKLVAPFRSGQEYIVPEYLPEWKELLRMEWRRSKEEAPRFAEEFTMHGEYVDTVVSSMPQVVKDYFGKLATKFTFIVAPFDSLRTFGLTNEEGPFETVKAAQAAAKIMKLSIYQVTFDETGIPSDPIIVKGRLTIKQIQPFLVIIRLGDGTVGFVSSDTNIHPIELIDLPKGMVDRIKPVSPISLS